MPRPSIRLKERKHKKYMETEQVAKLVVIDIKKLRAPCGMLSSDNLNIHKFTTHCVIPKGLSCAV